jgi:hypothetical protein
MEEIMDKVALKKKIDNYWYYYKIHTFAAIFIVIVLAILIQQCATTVKPDITIIIATKNPVMTTDQQSAMEKYLQGFTADVNKDGKKSVQCTLFYFSDQSTLEAEQTAFTANLTDDSNIIYIFDDSTYNNIENAQETGTLEKIGQILPDEKLSNPYKLPIGNTRLAGQSFSQEMTGLNVCVRYYDKSKKNSGYQANLQNSLNLIKKITVK